MRRKIDKEEIKKIRKNLQISLQKIVDASGEIENIMLPLTKKEKSNSVLRSLAPRTGQLVFYEKGEIIESEYEDQKGNRYHIIIEKVR